jgi:hypothetical protein
MGDALKQELLATHWTELPEKPASRNGIDD